MSTSTRVRAAFGGGVSLIALALLGLFAGVAAAAFGLDRRGSTPLRAVEGPEETVSESPKADTEEERRRAA